MGRLSHEVGWKYKAVVRTLENKRRVRAILEVQKRNKLKVTNISKIISIINNHISSLDHINNHISTHFPKNFFIYANTRALLTIAFFLQKLTKQAGEAVAKATEPYTAIINNFGYN